MPNSRGRFVWHDLTTPDRARAEAFYAPITSWSVEAWEDTAEYFLWMHNGAPVGGVVPMDSATGDAPTPPGWLPYVSVYDADETLRQAKSLGGSVRVPLSEIPSIGCWGVIADPFGAAIGVYEAAVDAPAYATSPKPGEFSWHELATADYKQAFEFYHALFKWERVDEHDMGQLGTYFIFGLRGAMMGGMFNRTADMPASAWLSYLCVADVKAAAERVQSLGGRVLHGPMEVPGGDWMAQCVDTQGATFALHTPLAT